MISPLKTTMAMKISVDGLKAKKACADQLALFERTFGDKPVSVTRANCLKAAEAGLDFDWAAGNLLSRAARANYGKVRDAARVDPEKDRDAARADYNKTRAAAWANYNKTRAAAWANYEKIRARAFWRASKIK